MFEELFLKDEEYGRTAHDKIFIACNASAFVPERLNDLVHELNWLPPVAIRRAVIGMFRRLVPEYQPLSRAPALSTADTMPVPVTPSSVSHATKPLVLPSPMGGSE